MRMGRRFNFDFLYGTCINEKDLEMRNYCRINEKGVIYTGYWYIYIYVYIYLYIGI